MDQQTALPVFECLSSSVRLDVFRLLVRAGPDGVVAGDIAAALKVAPSSLSFHLRTLSQAGLVGVEQEGRFLRYRANLSMITDVIGFLTQNCCGGAPCADLADVQSRVPGCLPSRTSDTESQA
jgi:DNA-binding transcriptional ArsR family regulator